MYRVVFGKGPKPARVAAVGEKPGREEAYRGYPFAGASGKDLSMYLRPYGIDPHAEWYITNLDKSYDEGNPDPTPADIEHWSAVLRDELDEVQPEIIIAIGRYAASWLLGRQVAMERVHGMPFYNAYNGAHVLPVYHPAAAMHQPRFQPMTSWDYQQVADFIYTGKTARMLQVDEYEGREDYRDVTGQELVKLARQGLITPQYSLDTEGTPANPWSVQVSSTPGTGYTLRLGSSGFAEGIGTLQRLANDNTADITIHNALYDIPMSRVMGLELAHVPMWDSMYAAYLLCFEAQGLKNLAYRFAGMIMDTFSSVVSGAGKQKQLEYLLQAASIDWPKPAARQVRTNNGITREYRPTGMNAKLTRMIRKINETGLDHVDLLDSWYKVSGEQYAKDAAIQAVRMVESRLGVFPEPTLADVPLNVAIRYASRDPDATLRVRYGLEKELEAYDLVDLMRRGMYALPVAEEVQATGMPAVRPHFEALHDEMMINAHSVQDTIIDMFVPRQLVKVKIKVPKTNEDGTPQVTRAGKVKMKTVALEQLQSPGFNPRSSKQVAEMITRRGLKALKMTKAGAPSTSAKSIGHLVREDDFVRQLFEYRHYCKVAGDFCKPPLDRLPENATAPLPVYARWSITRTTSRRYATSGKSDSYEIQDIAGPDEPDLLDVSEDLADDSPVRTARVAGFNLMNIPIRTELGKRVRAGYQCPAGYKMMSVDYGKIEPRVLAHLSADELMCAIFHEDRNIYKETGARCFGVPIEQITQEQYNVSKTLVLGQMYGMGALALRDTLWAQGLLHWILEQCEQLVDGFWNTFHGAAEYKRQVAAEARAAGFVRDHWGMYRYLPNLNSHDFKLRAEAERHAVSHKVQPMAQGMLQNATGRLWRELCKLRAEGVDARMCLQMHDEIVLIYRDDPGVGELLEALTIDSFVNYADVELSVPVVAEAAHGTSWAELK